MFSKKTSRADETPAPAVAPELQHGGKKAGPTPKRKEREAANRVPLVPGDRRAAAKVARAKIREERETQYRALQTGDERHLPSAVAAALTAAVRRVDADVVLLPSNFAAKEAAALGVYLHATAADLAAWRGGEAALIARDVAAHLGEAAATLGAGHP